VLAVIPDRRASDSLGTQATQLLRTEILGGRFVPGSRLNELRLANELALSRGPIREALRTLEREGLVVSLPNRGSFVARVTPDYMAEILDLREIVEPAAYRRSFARRSHGLAAPLLQALNEMRRAAGEDLGAVSALHADFHGVLYREAPGRLLAETWERLEVPVRIFHQDDPWTPDRAARYVEVHRQLADVLIAGDVDEGCAAIVAHLRAARSELPFPFSGATGATDPETR
jgi:DNA-binding GntR family transcriptional regulator